MKDSQIGQSENVIQRFYIESFVLIANDGSRREIVDSGNIKKMPTELFFTLS